MVQRLSRAPFLFKFCRVVYEKERKVLRLQDGEFVGRHFRSARGGPSVDSTIPDDEAVLHLEMEETSVQGKYKVCLYSSRRELSLDYRIHYLGKVRAKTNLMHLSRAYNASHGAE